MSDEWLCCQDFVYFVQDGEEFALWVGIVPGDADVGEFGTGMDGIEETTSANVDTLPWAARYLKCGTDMKDTCRQEKYCAKCWIDRKDGVKPTTNQRPSPAGQVSWHPGWRQDPLPR